MTDKQSQRQSVAQSMLESGMKPATVALRLQVRFNISRATAYRAIEAASNEIQRSDNGPASNEPTLDTADLAAALLYDASRCLAAGEHADACRLIGALDKVKRWQGSHIAVPPDETEYA